MSHLRANRLLSGLALVAVVLLVTLPTFGRLALPAHPPAHAMAMAGDGTRSTHSHEPAGAPGPHGHDADCAYCMLLSGVVPAPVLVPRVPAALPIRWVAVLTHRLAEREPPGWGLGARGPPRGA